MKKDIYEKYEIIDAHSHIFPEKIAEIATESIGNFYEMPMTGYGVSEKLIESGKKIGVSRYLVCSTATTPHQISAINHFISTECEAHPEFYGFGTTHADSENLNADIEEIIRTIGLYKTKSQRIVEQAHLLRIHSRRQLQFHLEQRVGDFRIHVQQLVQLREQFHACAGLAIQPLVHGGVQCPEGIQVLVPELEDGIGQLRVKSAKTADLANGFHVRRNHLEVQVAGQHRTFEVDGHERGTVVEHPGTEVDGTAVLQCHGG